jgi:hypothetical protein
VSKSAFSFEIHVSSEVTMCFQLMNLNLEILACIIGVDREYVEHVFVVVVAGVDGKWSSTLKDLHEAIKVIKAFAFTMDSQVFRVDLIMVVDEVSIGVRHLN